MIANKKQIFKLAGVVLTCAVISACSSSDPTAKTVGNSGDKIAGTADFTKFVSIGDSLTAGYSDGALYLLGQQNSFPKILSQQFAEVGGGAFTQPLVSDNLGGLLFGTGINPEFANRFALNTATQKPERIDGTPTTQVIGSNLNGMIFNNMGVPGAKSYHLGAGGYGEAAGLQNTPPTANPYFVRFSLDITSTTETVIGDAAAELPSFFTLWIGNNDVLSYATSGGVGAESCNVPFPPPAPAPVPPICGSNDITNPAHFALVYTQLVGALTTGPNASAKGVLINIPDVSTIPYFTTVPYNPVPLDQATADALNAAYADYNNGVAAILGATDPDQVAKRTITFTAGQNPVVILDETLTNLSVINPPATLPLINMRQATANDLIVLPTSSIIGELVNPAADPLDPASKRWGISAPLQDKDVLIPSEIQAIDTARTAFNATIKAAADNDPNLAFFDAAAVMKQLSEGGIDYGTGSVNADFATGGAFGLDGVHPTGRGYALIANKIIDVINSSFGANVYKVDPSTYPAVLLK